MGAKTKFLTILSLVSFLMTPFLAHSTEERKRKERILRLSSTIGRFEKSVKKEECPELDLLWIETTRKNLQLFDIRYEDVGTTSQEYDEMERRAALYCARAVLEHWKQVSERGILYLAESLGQEGATRIYQGKLSKELFDTFGTAAMSYSMDPRHAEKSFKRFFERAGQSYVELGYSENTIEAVFEAAKLQDYEILRGAAIPR